MASGRQEIKHTCMGYRRIVWSKKGSRLEWSWLDNILQQNGATADRHFLETVPGGKFIPGRNAWLMRPAPLCQSAFGVPQDLGVESYAVLQQQESAWDIILRLLPDTAQPKMRGHSAQPQGKGMHIHRKIHVCACVQTCGQILIVAPIVSTTAVKLCMRHASQTRSDVSNAGEFPQ